MRKILVALFVITLNFILFGSINFVGASSQPIYVDYVSAKDGDEFIWLYNDGDDFSINSLSIEKITGNKVSQMIQLKDKGVFKHGSYKEIRFDKDKFIPKRFHFKLIINGDTSIEYHDVIEDGQVWGRNGKISREDFLNLNLTSSIWEEDKKSIVDEQKENDNENPTSKDANQKQPNDTITENSTCSNVFLNEIFINSDKQFIEIRNENKEKINLKGCKIEIRERDGKIILSYIFDEKDEIKANGLFVADFLSKNLKIEPNGNYEILFIDNLNNETSYSYESTDRNSSVAYFGDNIWKKTFKVTRNKQNILQDKPECRDGMEWNFTSGKCEKIKTEKVCEDGYYLNSSTNRCNKIITEKIQEECGLGYYRNPETGRCKKIEVETPKTCGPGYYLNPETGRCRKIISTLSSQKLTACRAGYERNPETGRCRKVVRNTGAKDAVKENKDDNKSDFTGWLAIAGIVAVFIIILIWEFRKDIFIFFSKIKKKVMNV
ncbi:MAG: hypothetical protein Q4A23_00895 [bacterium]|nr:hypothetical protein [bacterium]